MSKISVWKCDETGDLFEDRQEYIEHLKKLARENLDERNRIRLRDSCLPVINRMKETCENFQEIIDYLQKHIDTFVKYFVYRNQNNSYERLTYKKGSFPIQTFEEVRNSIYPVYPRHNAIISGRYFIVYEKSSELRGVIPSNIFENCGIYFGSGSGNLINVEKNLWCFSGEWHILPNTGWKLVEARQLTDVLMKD